MFKHPNQLEIPTDRIEDALRQGAIPGFWGKIRIHVTLKPEAVFEIGLLSERQTVSQGDKVREESTVIQPSTNRFDKVKMKIAELREMFLLVCPVTTIEASFKDGHIVSFAVIDLESLAPREPRMRFGAVK